MACRWNPLTLCFLRSLLSGYFLSSFPGLDPRVSQILAAITEMQLTVEVSTHFDLPHSGRLPALGLELVKAILKANDPVGC